MSGIVKSLTSREALNPISAIKERKKLKKRTKALRAENATLQDTLSNVDAETFLTRGKAGVKSLGLGTVLGGFGR